MNMIAALVLVGSVAPAAADEDPAAGGMLALSQPAPIPIPVVNPCAHRVLCGRIRLVPSDPAERRAFYTLVAATVADDIITIRGLAQNGRRAGDALIPGAPGPGWHSTETDPLARPFVHSGTAPLFLFSLASLAARPVLFRGMNVRARTIETYVETAGHAYGIGTWLSEFHRESAFEHHRDTCSTQLASASTLGTGALTVGYAPAPIVASCQQFTAAPLVPTTAILRR